MKEYSRVIAIGDLHSSIYHLRRIVEDIIKFSDKDLLIFLGDYVDRNAYTKETITYLQALKRFNPEGVIALAGNHEHDFVKYISQSDEMLRKTSSYLWNGGRATLNSYGDEATAKAILLPFIDGLFPYFEWGEFVFTHGAIPQNYSDVKDVPLDELLRCRDYNSYQGDKTIIVGHSVREKVTREGRYILCDTGACFSHMGKLSGYNVLDGEVFEAVCPTRTTCHMLDL
jgi:serine/threonine protein phosphatase 1